MNDGIHTPLEICAGDEFTNGILQDFLNQDLQEAQQSKNKAERRVLEVMAGYGRNLPTLKKWFDNIELMDGCKELTDLIEEGIPKTTCYI